MQLEEMKIRLVCCQLRCCDVVQRYAVMCIDYNYRTRATVVSLTQNLCNGIVRK